MAQIYNELSPLREIYCINCHEELVLDLAERRGEENIVCPKCKTSFTLGEANEFMKNVSPILEGQCPSCWEDLTFDIEDRTNKDKIKCPVCKNFFYMREVRTFSSQANTIAEEQDNSESDKKTFVLVVEKKLKGKNSKMANDYIKEALQIYQESFSSEVEKALNKYLETEFDTNSKGLKGVGRMLTDIPRLAGYLIAQDASELIYKLKPNAILLGKMGFLSGILIRDNKKLLNFNKPSEDIYEKFVPNIFITPEEIHNNSTFKGFLSFLAIDTIEEMIQVIEDAQKDFDRTILLQIFYHYYIAGFALSSTLYNYEMATSFPLR